MLKNQSIGEVANALIIKFGEEIGSINTVKANINRMKNGKPRKSQMSPESIYWSNTVFYQVEEPEYDSEMEIETKGPGQPKSRLVDNPVSKTVRKIMKPKIDELIKFADSQGVKYEDVIKLLEQRYKKTKPNSVHIPTDSATSFFFNEGFSSRSWTELRLFLKQFGVELPTRNTIDEEKKTLHPNIAVQEIKSCVQYKDLVEDTLKG